jgi:hypothetical protein
MLMATYGYAFRDIKEKCLIFRDEPCVVKISLAIDSVNPFAEMRSIYLVWLVFVLHQ